MDILPNYNLIPYPDHDYQLKPCVPDDPVPGQNLGQESIAGHNRFRQPQPAIHTIHIDIPNQTYDVGQNLTYPQTDQVGHLIDIYA